MANVRVPTPLRSLCGGAGELQIAGETVSEVLEGLNAQYPGFRERLYGDDGKLRRFVNIYVGDEDVRFTDGVDTKVGDDELLSIVPAVAGGAQAREKVLPIHRGAAGVSPGRCIFTCG